MPIRGILLLALASIVLLAGGCREPGERLLNVNIELNGQSLLHATFSVPDGDTPQTAWRQLEGMALHTDRELKPDPGKPGQTTLVGKIRLVLNHAGTAFAAADVDQLQLVGDPAMPGIWRLAPGEMDRTHKRIR